VPNSDWHSFVGEKTEVLYDPDEIVRKTVDACYAIEHTVDGCVDLNGPSIFVIPNHPVTKAYVDMKNRGVRIRFISELQKRIFNIVKNWWKLSLNLDI